MSRLIPVGTAEELGPGQRKLAFVGPAHGLRFDVRAGCMPGAGGLSLTTFPVMTVDGTLVMSLPENIEGPTTSLAHIPNRSPLCSGELQEAPTQEKQRCKA